MDKRITIIILLGIIVLGAFFRFYNITEKGFFISDESFFAMVAKTLATIPKVVIDGVINHRENLGSYIKEQLWWGAQNTTARPGFIFPVAFLMMILGTHDYVPFIFNALLGALSILLVYLAGISIFKSPKIALAASFLLAISNYHIFYSRTGLSQITTGFFLVFAVLLYLRTFEKDDNLAQKLFLTGLCLGYLLSTHQSIVPMIGVVFLFDFIFLGKNFREKIHRLFYLGIGTVLIVFFWEIILGARKLIAKFFYLSGNVHTYLEELLFLFWNNVGGWPSNPDKFFYFDLLKRFDDWILVALLFLGILIFVIKKDWRNKKVIFIFILTWFVSIFWSFVPLKVPRIFAIFTPFLALFAAYSLWGLVSIFKNKIYQTIFVLSVIGLIFVLNFGTTIEILNLKSGYKEVSQYLKDKDYLPIAGLKINAAGSGWMHYDFYLNQKIENVGVKEDADILISDWGAQDSWQKFSKRGKLEKVFDNPIGKFLPIVQDYFPSASIEFAEQVTQTPGIDTIGIFTLR